MIDAPLAFAFAAGLVAAFNPCGFAMLPAYLAYFLGVEGSRERSSIARAVAVGGVVSAGFAVVFAVAGLLIVRSALAIQTVAPWLTIVIGLALLPLGLAMLRGFEPRIAIPRLQRGGESRGLVSMFVFGVSYATVSLSCTLPVFLAASAAVFDRGSLLSGMAVVLSYGLGMSLVLMALTIGMGVARQGILDRMRSVLPHVNRISGGLLLLAGAYVAWYGWVEVRVARGGTTGAVVDFVGSTSARVSQLLESVGPARLGVALAVVVLVSLLATKLRRSEAEPGTAGQDRARQDDGVVR